MNKLLRALMLIISLAYTEAHADITSQPFGPNQVFDVQYNWAHSSNPSSPDWSCYGDATPCDVLNVSGLTTPYASAGSLQWTQPALTAGQYYKFFNSTTNPGTYGLAVYNADGTQAFIMHNTGNFYKATTQGMFYIGGGFFGTVFSPSEGYALGSSASLSVGLGSPSSADLAAYVPSSTTVLAAGVAAGGGGSSPTVDHTNSAYERVNGSTVNAGLPVVTTVVSTSTKSETATVQTIVRHTTTTNATAMTTPVAVTLVETDVYTDGSTVVRRTAQPTEYISTTDVQTSTSDQTLSGRIDQYTVLSGVSSNINRMMNHNLLRQDGIKYEHGTLYFNGSLIDSRDGGYKVNTHQYGIAADRQIRGNWILGAQFNYIDSTMTGVDSTGSMSKSHLGFYSLYRNEKTLLQTDLGFANNSFGVSRNIENEFHNSSKTGGSDVWISNRLYNIEMSGIRPYVGVTLGRSTIHGYTESGSIESARSVGSISNNMNYAEAGVQVIKPFKKVNLFGEIGATTDGYTTVGAGVSYPMKDNSTVSASVSNHSKDGVSSNRLNVGINVRY